MSRESVRWLWLIAVAGMLFQVGCGEESAKQPSNECGGCEEGFVCKGESCVAVDPACVDSCAGLECGQSGERGDCNCGDCSNGEVCAAGHCADAACTGAKPSVEGSFKTSIAEVTFDAVSVNLFHKRDIDEFEDGCLSRASLEFTNQGGCTLKVVTAGTATPSGKFHLKEVRLSADSMCKGFADAQEGTYLADLTSGGGPSLGTVNFGISKVPDSNAKTSCFSATVEVELSGTMYSDFQTIEIESGGSLKVIGDVNSVGSVDEKCACVSDCAGKVCGDDGCGGSCGECEGFAECAAGQCLGCTPDCEGKECGDDGCGDSCGSCFTAEGGLDDSLCDEWLGQCNCPEEKCGGICCLEGRVCDAEDKCCQPDCAENECTDNGCDGNCECDLLHGCVEGICVYDECAAGESFDCYGLHCISTAVLGDGACDFDLLCEEWEFDGGDCCDDSFWGCEYQECGLASCGEECGACPVGLECSDGECI